MHNQISYTVGPTYFFDLKFTQFRIPDEFHNRIGAAWVGIQASWWMGLIIGTPIGVLSLFFRGFRRQVFNFSRIAIVVVLITFVVGICTVAFSLFTIDAQNIPPAAAGWATEDKVGFARATSMHNASYIGGLIGLIIGTILTFVALFQQRKS